MSKKFDVVVMLRRAASYMKRHGHCRYYLENDKGQVCLIGAVNAVVNGSPLTWNKETDKLRKPVEDFLRCDAISWNNVYSRRGSQVIAALRGAANKLARASR